MKRIIAWLSVCLMLITMMPVVSADDNPYNDDILDWGNHTKHVYTNGCDRSCDVCGALRSGEELQHFYKALVTDPDCENGGYTTYICYTCGDSYVADRVDALGHSYDDDFDSECNNCGERRGVEKPDIPDVPVVPGGCDHAGKREPTCIEEGYCPGCGVTYAPLGHSYDNDSDAECNNCGEEREVTPDQPDYSDYEYEISGGQAIITKYVGSGGDVVIPATIDDYPVVAVGWHAFFGCDSLTSVIIPEGVTTIDDNAFSGCDNLVTLTIPSSVTTIGYRPFDDCGSLTSFVVEEDNADFSAVDGVLFNKDKTTLLCYPGGRTDAYSIPDSVTTIGEWAFAYCDGLTSVTIPNSVTTICKSAFSLCTGLTNITIPDGVSRIDESAFSGCSGLVSVTLSKSVTVIIWYAFYNCSSLTDVYYTGSEADRENMIIESYNSDLLYATWRYAGEPDGPLTPSEPVCPHEYDDEYDDTCNLCGEEREITPEEPGNSDFEYEINDGEVTITKYIGDGGDVVIPSTLGGYPVTTIGVIAFYDCINLTSVIIPDSVTFIGGSAFNECINLTSVIIPDSVTAIGGSAFNGCISLTEVTIPDGVTTINYRTFYGCTSLTSVVIPNGITTIGYEAFSYCTSLTNVTIPDSVTTIDWYAFNKCTSLTHMTIPDSVTTIGDVAFYHCSSLTSMTMGDSVTSIGNEAFSNCTSLTDVYYNGTQADRENISIGDENDPLHNATWHYKECTHSWDPATCTKAKTCKVCGATEGEALGHDMQSDVTIAATCEEEGVLTYWCPNCDYQRSELISKSEHKSDAGTVTKKATCKATGTKTYKCTVCKTTVKTEPIAKLAHSYNAATCTKAKTCKVCGATSGSKLGHTYSKKVTKATLTKDGTIKNVCSKCGYTASSVTTIYKASKISLSKTSYTYNGKVQKPTVVVKNSQGKTISSSNYTVKYASGLKSAGTYKVTITMKGNYSGSKTLTYKINPVNVSKCKISLSKTSYTYNGKVQKPTVTVKTAAGTKLTTASYTVTYASGLKNAGTYKVTIKMKGNYTGTKTLTYKINPINISKCKISLSKTSFTYNGKAQKPTVTVKTASGTKLTTSAYTVTYASGRKNVGTYKVTVKMKGNYTGTKTLTFKINPVKTTVKSLTAGKKSLKVAITKKTTQVSGYQIQYSTSKSFKSYKTKTLSSYKKTSTTLTGLSAKKTYYVRVRTYKTVNGVKYYSGWCTVKYLKTK